MSTTITWMWIGSQPQINADPLTPVRSADITDVVGYKATGQTEIKAVDLSGDVRQVNTAEGWQDAFSTTYNQTSLGPSTMTYIRPGGDEVQSVITGFMRVDYKLTLPDGSEVTQNGVMIQMATGDTFFRPARDQLSNWDGITEIVSVEVVKVTPLSSTTFVAPISFKPTIHDVAIVCFVVGTMIRTDKGEVAVEKLRPGMMIQTRDHGLQPLRWWGASRIVAPRPGLCPIRIETGALGPGIPSMPLRVSPQHRILVSSAIVERMFGDRQVLVPAKHLTGLPGVTVEDGLDCVTYVHLMFDRHELVISNGAATESLYPGPEALKALTVEALTEIDTLFPGLLDGATPPPPARPFARGPKVRKMIDRHQSAQRALHE